MAARAGRILGASAVLSVLVLAAAGCSGPKPVIKLHDGQYDSLSINNAIAEFIIEKGYGYPVEAVVETTLVMQEAIQEGEVDLNLEGWQQNFIEWYSVEIRKGNIVNLGMTFEGGPQFFIIPRWVAEEHNIDTVFDMAGHWELFKGPEDPSKGVFYSCIIGWQCSEINTVKLEAYGLTRYYNVVSPGSPPALEAALARAQVRHQPVFGYHWAPTALMGAYDWHILEEPPYTDECWEKVSAAREDKSLRPIDQACAYQSLPIDKIAHKSLRQKAPEVAEMLRNMNVGLESLNRTLAWAKSYDVQGWEKAAIYYLQNHEDRWKTWVTPEVYQRIKKGPGRGP